LTPFSKASMIWSVIVWYKDFMSFEHLSGMCQILLYDTLHSLQASKWQFFHSLKSLGAQVWGEWKASKKRICWQFIDGRNFISDIKCNVNDSVLINLKDGRIEKCLQLKEKENAIIFAGKHSGKKGCIEKIDLKRKIAELSLMEDKSKKINVLIKQLMIIE